MTIRKLEDKTDRLLRDISTSKAISFGTSAPFALGRVGFDRIGFADIPSVGFRGYCRNGEQHALVPVARQHIMRAIAEAGLEPAGVSLKVTIGLGRTRMFTDDNPSSPSHGRRKRGSEARFSLEVDHRFARKFEHKLPRVYL